MFSAGDCALALQLPGCNFLLSLDCTQIVNYGQWQNRESVMAARQNPKIVALMAATEKVAGNSNSRPYLLRKSVPRAGK